MPPVRGDMTDEEARAVVALWSERKTALETAVSPPRLADVADALDITPEETQGLLDEVRAERARAAQTRRRLRRRRAVVAVLALVGLVWVSNVDFTPDSPTLTVENASTRTLPVGERPGIGIADDTRTDVVLQYHPHTLLRFLLGPHWSPFITGDNYLTDAHGRRYVSFGIPRGGQEGIGIGWLHAVGLHTYSIGYVFPLARVPPGEGPVSLHATIAADGQSTSIGVPIR